MKRKFLAKAITLGLMLAVPLGAQAETPTSTTDTADGKVDLIYNLSSRVSTVGALGITSNQDTLSTYNGKQINNLTMSIDKAGNGQVLLASTGTSFGLTLNGDLTLTSEKDSAVSLSNSDNTSDINVLLDAKNINITSNSSYAISTIRPPYNSYNANVALTAKEKININSKASAILLHENQNAKLSMTADSIDLTSQNDRALFIGATDKAVIKANKEVNLIGKDYAVNNYGSIEIKKLDADGSNPVVNIKGGVINDKNSRLDITAKAIKIDVDSEESRYVLYGSSASDVNLTATDGNIEISGKGKPDTVGLYLDGKAKLKANQLKVETPGTALRSSTSSDITIEADTVSLTSEKKVIHANSVGKITFDSKNVNITTKKQDKPSDLGIAANSGATIQFTDKVENVNINSNINVKSGASLIINAKESIKITGDIMTTGEGKNEKDEDGNIKPGVGGNITIGSASADGNSAPKINIVGDVYRGQLPLGGGENNYSEGGSLNIVLNNRESSLKGNIYDKDAKDGDTGSVKLEVSNGATWTTNGNSTVKEVKSNGGVINLAGNGQNVNINNLTNGSGFGETPKATTIKTDSINNKLNIGSNENKLEVEASSKVTDSMGNDIQGGMKKLLNNINVENGTKETTVTAAAGSVTGETTITRDADGNSSAAKEEVHKENAGISEMASIALMAWRAENNDMNKRLGELRNSKGEHGIWTRMVRGQSKYGAQNVKNQYSTYQLGYDEKLSVDKNWTVGAAVSYTDASSSFSTGRGENKSTGFAVYGSYLSDNGSFVDLIAKAARLKNEFDVLGGAGKGDYETNGYSLSAEYGKRFTKDNGFWIEPQVELTYGYVGAVDYLTNNDVQVRQNGMDSLVGRIGFAMGRNIKAGNVYARASYLYDFDGETDVTFSKNNVTRGFKQDLGGGWWEVGVGTNINLSDATHLYFDVEKTYGGNVATPWQWNAGVRWSF